MIKGSLRLVSVSQTEEAYGCKTAAHFQAALGCEAGLRLLGAAAGPEVMFIKDTVGGSSR